MLKFYPPIAALILMMLPLGPSAFAEDTMDALTLPVGTLTISAPRGVAAVRSPVAFPHSRHFDYTCKTCHHHWDGFSRVKSCTASGCHDRTVSKRDKSAASRTRDKRYYKTAYHMSCIACHKKLSREREALEKRSAVLEQPLPNTGPTGCVGCHPKE